MANPSSVVPYNDPHDALYTDDITNFLDIQNPTLLEDLNTQEIPLLYPSSIPQSSDQIDDITIDPLEDPVIKDFCNEPSMTENSDSLGVSGKTNNQKETNTFGSESLNNMNSRPLSVWPSEPVPFGCSCCQVLREIVHTNGIDVTKLEIHGRLGMICHAILSVEPGSNTAITPNHHYQMFDFCKKNIKDLKQFLTQYCTDRSQAGYMMIKDPLSIFYEALCVGLAWDEESYNGDFIQPSSSNSRAFQMNQAGNNNNQEKTPKPSLAIQVVAAVSNPDKERHPNFERERTRNLTLKEIENYFHLPIEEAAKRMEFSATVVKKICRKYGVTRWPHRKIQSMEKQISNWASRLSSKDPEERARAENEIESLQREIAKFGEVSSKQADDYLEY